MQSTDADTATKTAAELLKQSGLTGSLGLATPASGSPPLTAYNGPSQTAKNASKAPTAGSIDLAAAARSGGAVIDAMNRAVAGALARWREAPFVLLSARTPAPKPFQVTPRASTPVQMVAPQAVPTVQAMQGPMEGAALMPAGGVVAGGGGGINVVTGEITRITATRLPLIIDCHKVAVSLDF